MAQDDPQPVADSASASHLPASGSGPATPKSLPRRVREAVEAFHDRYRVIINVATAASLSISTVALFGAGDYANTELILTPGACVVVSQDLAREQVLVVGCLARHNAEVMWHGVLTDVTAESSPAGVSEQAERQCTAQFESYVGRPLQESVLKPIYLLPSSASWKEGDRSLTCIVFDPRVSHLAGTLRGARE